ncbi:MAG: efflux RND transporter periplasmic adaptor subunit [Chromatiaceae bacterium]|jgi:membrane fusion protein (multidrug efflux system)|nr:efflux RND transporter periplasmic adaptor subunit [Chromatiaceae bacterium]
MRSILLHGAMLILPALFLGACGKPAAQSAQNPSIPTPQVEVVQAKSQSVPLTRELVGRLAATRVAQVRARVAGIVLTRVYTEGTDVKAGDVLFRIDPAQLEATLHAQEATLAKAQADAANAALTAKRYLELREKHTLSQQDLDTAQANERTTAAIVKQAQANVETAKLNLSYATVRAPIAGRAGRALVTEGALVGQNEATQLTTIEQIDPIYVNFSQSVSELAELEKAKDGAGQEAGQRPEAKVEIVLPEGSIYPHAGAIDFSDMAVDPGTGALSLRAVVANPSKRLLPGMFVTLRLTSGQIDNAFLLPQAALLRDAAGAYVLVLNDAGKVEQRRVETRGMTREDWIVTGSLADGDQVIVSGLQKVEPGAEAKIAPPAEGAAAHAPAET